jgi:hypothetical protein
MIKTNTGIALWIVSIISSIYFVWSLFTFQKYQNDLEIEKERVYSIADQLELWKKISIEYDGRLYLEKLSNDPRNISVKKIDRKEGVQLSDKNDTYYVMFHDKLDDQRKLELKKYFSELVLGNYFYIITNKNGEIKEMFWDKP